MTQLAKNISELLKKEEISEEKSISLIPSENIMSPLASSVYSHRAANRYLLPIDFYGKFAMPGRQDLEAIVLTLSKQLKKLYNMENVFVKGLSGLQQMGTIFLTFSGEIDECAILDPFDGGHLSTQYIAKKFSYKTNYLHLDYTSWDLDYAQIQNLIATCKKKMLIYLDHTIVLKPFDIKKLLQIVPENWIIYYDISHLQLFYTTRTYTFPKKDNFFFGGSTHKTFPGPQKAVLFCNNGPIYEKLKTAFNETVSSYHMGSILSLLIASKEMEVFGKKYVLQILANSTRLAANLSHSLNVVGPKPKLTFTHQVCVDVDNINDITNSLANVRIITTPMRVPSTKRSGLRLGVQEITRFGMEENEIDTLSEIITHCSSQKPTNAIKKKVETLAQKHRKLKYCFESKII